MPPSVSDQLILLEDLLQGDGADPTGRLPARILADLRRNPAVAPEIDQRLLNRLRELQQALRSAQENLQGLATVLEKLKSPPWFPATFIELVPSRAGPRALVRLGGHARLVGFGPDLDTASFHVGDWVFLTREQNVILERSPVELGRSGEVGCLERVLADGRLVVKSGEITSIVSAARGVTGSALKAGSLLRWDRSAMLAYEPIERATGEHHFLEQTPSESFDDIGGLGSQITRIKNALAMHFEDPERARRYRLSPPRSILLYGPSGTGKTLVAKAVANWLAKTAPGGRSFFANIKPSSLNIKWFGESEAGLREVFRVARETAATNPGTRVVLFFDEVDSIGSTRGDFNQRINDQVLTAFLAELDGLEARGDVLVVGATNRRDALDPALARAGRLGDLVLEVPRPDRKAARDIFDKHLAVNIPYGRNGHGDDAAATRAEMIEMAAARLYAPNAENELATITFRDGQRRTVRAADLVSGSSIAHIARCAIERAYFRKTPAQEGVVWQDLALAIDDALDEAARGLTPANCRDYLSGLPYDRDVVNVEPVVRKVSRPKRYLNVD